MSVDTDICLLEPQLQLGLVSSISASNVKINLDQASRPTAVSQKGRRYGLGEVGEFVLIEGDDSHLLGRIVETKLPENERLSVEPSNAKHDAIHPIGTVMLLGTFDVLDDKIRPGIQQYPRLGSRVYSAPHGFLAKLPSYLDSKTKPPSVTLDLGTIKSASNTQVKITPERVFGRHCAILGTTGGGKSYTVARLLGESMKYNAKVILLDATGEYRDLPTTHCQHFRMLGVGTESRKAAFENVCRVSPQDMTVSDFMALFQPSGKVQGPKLYDAIRSLKYVSAFGNGNAQGCLEFGFFNSELKKAIEDPKKLAILDQESSPFEISHLANQISHECTEWNRQNRNFQHDAYTFQYCMSLVGRIRSTIRNPSLTALFRGESHSSISQTISTFFSGPQSILRISLEDIGFDFCAREILANLVGRWLLREARDGNFLSNPLLIVLDEAHQFLNKSIGSDDWAVRLDAYDLIAKEGRKYGLNICLATQRPRDLPEGVLSQMGTLIVHRLTNDRDREIVERACGEIDRSASAFLPNLQPGEAALIGVDFPIPMTIQMKRPEFPPQSSGPNYQAAWKVPSSLPLPNWAQ